MKSLTFAVNGCKISIPEAEVDPSMTLSTFLRSQARCTSVKIGCEEGGCGSCAVTISDGTQHKAVNACLKPLASMEGLAVTTVEGLSRSTNESFDPATGLRKAALMPNPTTEPLHPIIERFASRNAAQCGFCTPGMVMSAYAALKSRQGETSMSQMEQCIDGNLCRCTGYRPILESCKSLAKDTTVPPITDSCTYAKVDDSSGSESGPYPTDQDPKFPQFLEGCSTTDLKFKGGGIEWLRPTSLNQALTLWKQNPDAKLFAGCTGWGVFKHDPELNPFIADKVLDIQAIPELSDRKVDKSGLKLGGACTLSDMVVSLEDHCKLCSIEPSDTGTMQGALIAHLLRTAGTLVRNSGTLAGNIAMTKSRKFESDLATLLIAVRAQLSIISASGSSSIQVQEFLSDTTPALSPGQIIESITIPLPDSASANSAFATYRVAHRRNNSVSLANAAFSCTFRRQDEKTILESVTLIFGAATPMPTQATRTEQHLIGKPLEDDQTFKTAMDLLLQDTAVKDPFTSKAICGFLFKFVASIMSTGDQESETSSLKVASKDVLARGVSSSLRSFTPAGAKGYEHKPIPKDSNRVLASGKAQFLDDIPEVAGTLHAAYVVSPQALGVLRSLDATDAMAVDGVVGFVDASHIPGSNNCDLPFGSSPVVPGDFVFVPIGQKIKFKGQAVGLICATSVTAARKAAALVKVEIEGTLDKPVFNVWDAKKDPVELPASRYEKKIGDADGVLENLPSDCIILSGVVNTKTQKHFYLEPQCAMAIPDEEGKLVVSTSTQTTAETLEYIAQNLCLPHNMITVKQRRAGGGFGGKGSRALPHAVAAAVAANAIRRPVKLVLDRATDTTMTGSRHDTEATYQVVVQKSGKIVAIKCDGIFGGGFSKDWTLCELCCFGDLFSSQYDVPHLLANLKGLETNLASNTPMRGPGVIQACLTIESIMEHIAVEVGMTPDAVRTLNLIQVDKATEEATDNKQNTIARIWRELHESSHFHEKYNSAVDYNQRNRWKKRGIAMTPVKFFMGFHQTGEAYVKIYRDGTVGITHHGCEIGQGLNMKCIQMAADRLNCLFSSEEHDGALHISGIRVEDQNTFLCQVGLTGGSTTSEVATGGIHSACAILVERLKPVKEKLLQESKSGVSWCAIVDRAHNDGVQLAELGHFRPPDNQYLSAGAAVSEVEVDAVTGEMAILSSHILFDCAKSMNPAIDVGQIEGAFVQGIGFFTTENIKVGEDGSIQNPSTWGYKIPSSQCIPLNFRVDLLDNDRWKNNSGAVSSKAVGEPPLMLATSVWAAMRMAIASARADAGLPPHFVLPPQATAEVLLQACGTTTASLSVTRANEPNMSG